VLLAESLDQTVTIVGLTLTGGRARGETPYGASGGGLLVSNATVRLEDAVVDGNTAAGSGGGIRVCHGKVVLLRCAVRANTAADGGGGLDASYDAEANALEVEFRNNDAGWGGALSVRAGSRATVFTSLLVGNRATTAPGLGGALACDLDAEPVLRSCVLADNEARYGGAIYATGGAAPVLSFVTIDRNEASQAGAALYCRGVDPQLDHTIVSFHPQAAFALLDDARPEISASDIFGNTGGNWVGVLRPLRNLDGNFSADPLFCASNDRNLREASPCAPEHSGVGLVGALGVGCQTTTDTPPVVASAQLAARPNPFNPATEVVYLLPAPGRVRLSVYDLRGRRLDLLVDEDRPAGEHRVRWQARDATGRTLASGTYLLVLETGGQRLTSKLMLVR
jgi:hypothetical protein